MNKYMINWTNEETSYLKENYLKIDYHQIAKSLGKSYDAVNQRRHFLKLEIKKSGRNVKPATCKIISKETAIYISGLFDGEGTIQIENKHNKLGCRIAIGTVNLDIMQWLKEEFNCGIVYTNNKGISMWAVNTRENLKVLLPQIIPYLKVKKARVEQLLKTIQEYKRGQVIQDTRLKL